MTNRKAHAVTLLTKVIAAGWCDVPRLATELVTDERTLGLYLAGVSPMPPERQMCFALYLIDHVPPLSRDGHNLLSRARAQLAYSQSITVTHQTALMPIGRSY